MKKLLLSLLLITPMLFGCAPKEEEVKPITPDPVEPAEDDDDEEEPGVYSPEETSDSISIVKLLKLIAKLKKFDEGCYYQSYKNTFTEETNSHWNTSTKTTTQEGTVNRYADFTKQDFTEKKSNMTYNITYETGITTKDNEDNFYQIRKYPRGYGESSYVTYLTFNEALKDYVFTAGFGLIYASTLVKTLQSRLDNVGTDMTITSNLNEIDLSKEGTHTLKYTIDDNTRGSRFYYHREDTLVITNSQLLSSVSEVTSDSNDGYLSMHSESTYQYKDHYDSYSGNRLNPRDYSEKELDIDDDDDWDHGHGW